MPIAATCTHCGKEYSVSRKFAGKKAKCTGCGNAFAIPAVEVAAAPSATSASPDDDLMAELAAAGKVRRTPATAKGQDKGRPPGAEDLPEEDIALAPQCPSCRKPMDAAAVVCIECGYHRRLNQTMQVQISDGRRPAAAPAPAKPARSLGALGNRDNPDHN